MPKFCNAKLICVASSSTLAQRKRVGLITQRSLDRDQQVLSIFLYHARRAFAAVVRGDPEDALWKAAIEPDLM